MTEKKALLTVPGREPIELPIRSGTLGQDVIDVGGLGSFDYFTFDPGFTSTASCESKITYIDGDQGILLHRGYPIEELAENSDYLETCYLLLNGDLPNAMQKKEFENIITTHTMVNRSIEQFMSGFRYDAHPMAMMCGAVGAVVQMTPIYVTFSLAQRMLPELRASIAGNSSALAPDYRIHTLTETSGPVFITYTKSP